MGKRVDNFVENKINTKANPSYSSINENCQYIERYPHFKQRRKLGLIILFFCGVLYIPLLSISLISSKHPIYTFVLIFLIPLFLIIYLGVDVASMTRFKISKNGIWYPKKGKWLLYTDIKKIIYRNYPDIGEFELIIMQEDNVVSLIEHLPLVDIKEVVIIIRDKKVNITSIKKENLE